MKNFCRQHFVCPLYSGYREFKRDPFNRLPEKTNPVAVDTDFVNYNKPNINAILRIPVLKSSQYGEVINNINESIRNDINEFSDEMTSAAEQYSAEAQKQGKKFIPYTISTVYEVTYNKNDIFSISILYYENVEGRNYYIKTAYNYDLKTGKSLGLQDLFIAGVDYKEILNKEIKKQLILNKEKYFPNAAANFKGIAEDQPFYLKDSTINIFFGFNQIAPMATDIPIITIPFVDIQNVLKPRLIRQKLLIEY